MALLTSKMSLVLFVVVTPMNLYVTEIYNLTEYAQEPVDYTKRFDNIEECKNFVHSPRYQYT